MGTYNQAILRPLDISRAIGGILGRRQFQVISRRRVWSGSRPGIPGTTKVDTDTVLTNTFADGSLQPVGVRQVSRSEAIASGGVYTSRDMRVGPMTPPYAATVFGPGAGFDDVTMDPAPTGQAVEIIWIITTPNGTFGIPDNGVVCEKKGEDVTDTHYYIILRSTGRTPT